MRWPIQLFAKATMETGSQTIRASWEISPQALSQISTIPQKIAMEWD